MNTEIIAEAGINHNGDVDRAKQMRRTAKWAEVDAIKFQSYQIDKLISDKSVPYYQSLKSCELSFDDQKELFKFAEKTGIEWFSTPSDIESADFLNELGVKRFKIGSDDVTNLPLLNHVGGFGKPVLMSTGMSTIEEIMTGFSALRYKAVCPITLLHCIAEYPVRPRDLNLRFIPFLRKIFEAPIGFSDHTFQLHIYIIACCIALGASVIEKHFTLNHDLEGPDHSFSITPDQMKFLVDKAQRIEAMLGDGTRELTDGEKKMRKIARKSLFASRDIKKGDIVSEDMIKILRPSTGVPASHYGGVIGSNAPKYMKTGEMLRRKDRW